MQLNEHTIFILGRPNFWCASVATRLRLLGHEILPKSENEQAYVINFLLEHYEKHGDDWRNTVDDALNTARN